MHAAELLISPKQVIGTITHDWNDDGGMDRAILFIVPQNDEASLVIYLSNPDDNDMAQSVLVPGIAWVGGLWGQQPELSLNGAGSLIVTSMNEGCCRTRWNQKLTIAFRNGQFVVAGYTHTDRDTLELENYGTCDVNFLAGKGEVSRGGKAKTGFRAKFISPPLVQWNQDLVPAECTAN